MSRIPAEPSIFKNPATARSRIYINDAGKAVVDRIIAAAGLTGIECGPLAPGL